MLHRLFRLASGLAVCGLLGLSTVQPTQAAPARWSLDRASLGFDAKGAVTDSPERSSSLLVGSYLSYSLTQNLSIAGTVERDFPGKLTIGRAGLRFPIARLADGHGRLAAAVGVVAYGDEGASGVAEATSWDAGLHGSWLVAEDEGQAVLWGIASATYDSENTRTTYRLGLRWQAIGGQP